MAKKTVQLDGDIVFDYDAITSGTVVDTTVKINLAGPQSYWKGRIYAMNDTEEEDLPSINPNFQVGAVAEGLVLDVSNQAQWTATGNSFVNKLSLKDGGIVTVNDSVKKLTINSFKVEGLGNQFTMSGDTTLDGSITIAKGSELITNLATAFTGATVGDTKALTLADVNSRLSFVDSQDGVLSISDSFTYTGSDLTKLTGLYKDAVGLNFANASLFLAEDEDLNVTTEVTTGSVSGGNNVTVSGTGALTIAGEGETSEIGTMTVDTNGTLNVNNNSSVMLDELAGNGTIYVGNDDSAGTLAVNNLTFDGLIVLDPDFTTGSTIADASNFALTSLAHPVASKFAVLRNSVISLGAPIDTAYAAFNSLAQQNGLIWASDGVSAAAYVDAPVDFGSTGGIVIDGSKTSSTAPAVTANEVNVAAHGMLIVNQQNVGDKQVFTTSDPAGTTVTFAEGSFLGLVNAVEGTLTLADNVTADPLANVVTDNPFFTGAFDTNAAGSTVVTTSFDSASGLSAIASAGIQSMARRADFVMSETVANRTSLDQQLNAGVNLWVDVTGERYEADKLDNNGSFRADAGYATFGGDVQVADGLTAGLALQYGDATVRSDVASIKNEINSYGLTAYVGQTFGAAKVVGEVAWLRTENDITSAQAAMNQSLDTNVYSAGVRAQYKLTAGAFKFVPSIGLRVSHLETDDMTIGTIKANDSDLTYVQMPIALRITGAEVNASGWTFAPSFKVAYVPTFGDKDIKVLGYSQDVLDMSPVQADFGLRAVNGNLMFNADMQIGGGEYGTSSVGGKVGVKYVF